MKKITELNLDKKTVILRADLNVPIKNGKILNDEKIKASLKTIKYLIDNKSKIIIMSHLGKIKTEEDKKENTLEPIYKKLKKYLGKETNIYFSKETKGKEIEEKIKKLKEGEILLIENTRYEDLNHKKESSNDDELSKYWASLGDVFINDAFGVSHRKHASNYGISKYLESGYGFLLEEEKENLDLVLKAEKPFTVVMGGAKVTDKIKLISNILEKCDHLLLGGGIANTFLSVNNEVGKSLTSPESILDVTKLLKKYPEKIIMPVDVIVLSEKKVMPKFINEINKGDIIYDLGPESIKLYKSFIEKSKTVFINGTVGYYEDPRFKIGTRNILEISSKAKGNVILGGGDALASAEHFKIKGFKHKSTGGGATLEYIGTGKIASLED